MRTLYTFAPLPTIIILCWAIWGIYWIAVSGKTKQKIEQQSAKQRGAYVWLLGIGFVLALSETSAIYPLNIQLFTASFGIELVGAIVVVLGLIFTLWARVVLADNWSADVALKKDHVLIEKGPYAIVRHPIYTGLTAMFLGTAFVVGTLAPLLGLVAAFISFLIKLKQEDAFLVRQFPNEYPVYQKRVKAIIPFIL